MALIPSIPIRYPLLAVCGLSCRLCPRHHSEAASRCGGCKTESRLGAACPLQTCALKRHGVEYCGDCPDCESCSRWTAHREAGRRHDSFVSYRELENNIARIRGLGIPEWEKEESRKERLLHRLLEDCNEGRSCSFFCLAVTLLPPAEIEAAMEEEKSTRPAGSDIRMRSKAMRALLEQAAEKSGMELALRKKTGGR